ncbi:MAG: SDR family oxidoreductase [Actinomycetota bacterium]|nr:SDR family oxidoreductase [Actinomycetota bacterium]
MPRRAVLTGGNSGIGKATVVALARAGWDIGFTWHESEEGAREATAEVEALGRRAVSRPLDLQAPEDGPPAIEALADELGGLELFVNNAGAGHTTPFLELDLATWQRTLNIDLTGAFLCAQAAARRMVRQGGGGSIVNVTSVHEHVPLANSSAYCAAKGGLGLLTKVMALELAEHGIRVNAVAPGEIATKMTGNENVDPHGLERPGIPAGRPGHAAEIGEVVAFLASDGAGYLTGESVVVDGGLLLMAAQANQALGGG